MDLKTLQTLYPELQLSNQTKTEDNLLSLYIDEKIYTLPYAALSQREAHLLTTLYPNHTNTNPWLDFLMHNGPIPPHTNKPHQFIFFKHNTTIDNDLWLRVLSATFQNTVTTFLLNAFEGVLITTDTKRSLQHLSGIFTALEADFSVKTNIYLSTPYPITPQLPKLFQEDHKHFQINKAHISTFKSSFIPSIITPTLQTSAIAKHYQQQLQSFEGSDVLIKTLWNHQANISSAAQALYIHRNTMNYRIDKFLETTGLNLRNLDDLMLAYLLTQ